MQAQDLENLLKSEIPLSTKMEIQNLQLFEDELSMTVPLEPNVNHKGTMFGGSLYAAGALSCYGLFLAGLQGQSIFTNNIVISKGEMKYTAPVNGTAVVRAFWSSHEEKEQFFKTLHSKKRARVVMRAQVLVNNQECAEFSGHFVAHT